MADTKKILVVDDEESLCEILQFNLEVEGYNVDVAYSAEQALEMNLESYDLLLLDVMMGGMSGFKMAKQLKKNPKTENTPIIFCTAKDTEDDTVMGLNIGADDYISKPFSTREVVARVKSILRRTSSSGPASIAKSEISYETLKVDLAKKVCTLDGIEVQLTKKELDILSLLMQNRGRIFSREEILRLAWSDEVIVLDRTVDVNITRLRKKIGPYGDHIVTRLGYGYGFES
ncbi:MAG: response regulator transcription factor [Rikenellaceae bacterium]